MRMHCKYKLSVIAIVLMGIYQNALAEDTDRELTEVNVVGRSEGQSYYSSEAGISRSDTPLREIPQAVRIVPRQAIDDIGAVRLEEAYDYVSGINRQNNFGGLWDNFSIRGFAGNPNTGANMLRNGFAANRGYNAPREMANIERLEVIKGPASALYGSSEPGGILNIVTKKPQFKTGHAVELYAGSYDSYRLLLDTTGPVTDTLAYRLNVAGEDKGSFRDHIDSQRYLLAPSLTWLPTPHTIVNYDIELFRQKHPMDRGIAAINGEIGHLPRERFLGEPNDGDITMDNQTHLLTVEHEISSDWRAKAGLSYRTTRLEGYSTETSPRSAGRIRWTTAGAPFIERERRLRDYDSDDIAFQGEAHGKFTTGQLKHELLAGIDSYRFKVESVMKRGRSTSAYGLNIYDPVYGQTPLPLNTTPSNSRERQYNTAFFLQDQLSLSEHWRLLLGLRHDRYRQNVDNRNNGTHTKHEQNVTTPRIGVTWLATPTLSAYALASESFRPNGGSDINNRPFEPERGKSKEVGLKYESQNRRYGGTMSIFEITKKNVLTNDPDNAGYSVTAGEARSRGIEFDFSGQLTDKVRLLANYAYIDAKITKDNNPALKGARLLNIPKHGGSLLAMYEDGFKGGRYGIGAGMTYVGKRAGNAIDTFDLPGYATVRTMAYWRPSPGLRFSLDIDNLFDKHYYASSYDIYWITPGTPRTITLGMQARF